MIHFSIESGPVDLKIRGVEGGTIQEVLDQAKQGARFVLYQYAVAFVTVSFKRPSDIFCIRPGRGKLLPGLRYSFLSMLIGWWSLPTGIVFTIQALTRNFSGGLDVTDQVVAALSNAPADSAPHLILTDSSLALAPPVPPVVFDLASAAATAARRRRDRNFFLLVGAIMAALLVYGAAYRATHYPLALVNGTESAYSIVLDGKSFPLLPGSARIVEVRVGKHSAAGALPDGSVPVRDFAVGADWYDLSKPSTGTIVNLDRLALFVEEHQVYGKSVPPTGVPRPRVWATHEVVTTNLPFFFFEEFPPSVEATEGSNELVRNRIGLLPSVSVAERIRLLSTYGSEEDLHEYRVLLTRKSGTSEETATGR